MRRVYEERKWGEGLDPTTGTDGRPLPILPPNAMREWARLDRVMFYTPGLLALLR
jgi:hypothetical protein